MRVFKRVLTAAAVVCSLVSSVYAATEFPSRVVKIVVPFGAGGLTDILARAMAQDLAKILGQPVIVENRPGASGAIAASHVAQSNPDGHTLFFANDTALSVNQYLYKKLSYNPERDFRPVHNVAGTRNVLLASKKSGFKTVDDMLRAARQRPGEVSYGSFGVGSTPHLVPEEMAARAGVKLNHIPYNGNAETVTALIGGHIDLAVVAIPVALPLLQSDKVEILGVVSPERYPGLPDVPTLEEAGIKGLNSQIYFGLVAPAGTPDDVVRNISDSVAQVITQPKFRQEYIESKGMELIDQDASEFGQFLKEDRARYKARIESMNLSLD